MTETEVEQNTPEWEKYRKGPYDLMMGASSAGTMCGVSANVDLFGGSSCPLPFSLYDHTIFPLTEEEENPPACVHGHQCEPYAGLIYDKLVVGVTRKPGNHFTHPNEYLAPFLGCSPDGQIFDESGNNRLGLLEIKCPYHVMYDKPKPEHLAQMMFQMWITGQTTWCDYLAVKYDKHLPENGPKEIMLKRVYYSEDYVERLLKPRVYYFIKCLLTKTRPPKDLYRPRGPHGNVGPPDIWMIDYFEGGF